MNEIAKAGPGIYRIAFDASDMRYLRSDLLFLHWRSRHLRFLLVLSLGYLQATGDSGWQVLLPWKQSS